MVWRSVHDRVPAVALYRAGIAEACHRTPVGGVSVYTVKEAIRTVHEPSSGSRPWSPNPLPSGAAFGLGYARAEHGPSVARRGFGYGPPSYAPWRGRQVRTNWCPHSHQSTRVVRRFGLGYARAEPSTMVVSEHARHTLSGLQSCACVVVCIVHASHTT